LVPYLNTKQIRILVLTLPFSAFSTIIPKMRNQQIIETIGYMDFQQTSAIFSHFSPSVLSPTLPYMSDEQLVVGTEAMKPSYLNNLIKFMTPEQKWVIIPHLSEEQKECILEDVMEISDEAFPFTLYSTDSTLLAIGMTDNDFFERVLPYLDKLTPNQIWMITPILSLKQIVIFMESIENQELTDSILFNLSDYQKVEFIEYITVKITTLIHKLNLYTLNIRKTDYHITVISEEIEKLEMSLQDKNYDRQYLQSELSKIKTFIQNTIRPRLDRTRLEMRKIKEKSNAFTMIATHCVHQELYPVIEQFDHNLNLCFNKSKSQYLKVYGSDHQSAFNPRLQKLSYKLEDVSESKNEGLSEADLFDRDKVFSAYEGARDVLEWLGASDAVCVRHDLGYEDLIEVGITSIEELNSRGIVSLPELEEHIKNYTQ
jgi:hypothetical protein